MTLAAQTNDADRPDAGSPARTAAFISDALGRVPAANCAQSVCMVTVPAPRAPLEALLELMPSEEAFLWDPPGSDDQGDRVVGVGSAFSAKASGEHRLQSIARAAEDLWPRLHEIRYPGIEAPAPRLFGGIAFAAGNHNSQSGPWAGFGDADFSLPRWSYGRSAAGSWLRVAVTDWDQSRVRDRVVGAVEETLARLANYSRVARLPANLRCTTTEPDAELWRRQVEAIRGAIESCRCEKIVAARSSVIDMNVPVSATTVVNRLGARYPDCFRFAFRRGDASFVGATPERLIARHGSSVETEALAGTATLGNAEALMHSTKDRGEQAPVVRVIRDLLEPMCDSLDVPSEPSVRKLPGMLHLQTRIHGRLSAPVHVLELVDRLHPTPAVGGVPTVAAMNWIAEHEPEPRGWYASPVGWFDANGDGEFAVAIRSGLLRGARAHLFAGAGIVADSDPVAELAETRLKLRPLGDALGVDG